MFLLHSKHLCRTHPWWQGLLNWAFWVLPFQGLPQVHKLSYKSCWGLNQITQVHHLRSWFISESKFGKIKSQRDQSCLVCLDSWMGRDSKSKGHFVMISWMCSQLCIADPFVWIRHCVRKCKESTLWGNHTPNDTIQSQVLYVTLSSQSWFRKWTNFYCHH